MIFSKYYSEIRENAIKATNLNKVIENSESIKNKVELITDDKISSSKIYYEAIQKDLDTMELILFRLFKLVLLIGVIAVVFGTAYIRVIVQIIFRHQWKTEEMIRTLTYFCVYIFAFSA